MSDRTERRITDTVKWVEVAPDETPGPHPSDFECDCDVTGTNRFHLSIEEGHVSLVHAACGKPPMDDAFPDNVQMDPIPVDVTLYVESGTPYSEPYWWWDIHLHDDGGTP